ncbi:MAG: TIGR01212 family radical SAM protein [Oscillospiraceae bacterium]|nr:TIGR01212 family radical SAM protein [Oscillospiraceae bacterium]
MDNPFPFSDTNKRYHTQSYYLKQRFGCKVMKISLNCGFTCPNIDGTKGVGGCTYCSAGSGEFAGQPWQTVTEQFRQIKEQMNKKWSEGLYIPYFQANTNTYAPVERVRSLTEEALGQKNVVGISISTRPDCVSEEMADYLGELAQRTYLTVELGLQTVHDKTAEIINRCHSYSDFLRCYEMLRKRNINVCVHLINGLPGEDFEMMMKSAYEMSKLELHSIKLHLLHILKETVMAEQYSRGEIIPMTLEEYRDIICAQLEILPPELIIQRVTGDGGRDSLLAPMWSLKKFTVMNEIDKKLAADNSWQGKKYCKN